MITKFFTWSLTLFALGGSLLSQVDIAEAATFTFNIDPKATYLRNDPGYGGINSVPILLQDLGISGGDFITLEQLGDFSLYNDPKFDFITTMLGVFSASSLLSPATELNRVVDAIDSGNDIQTGLTLFGKLPTDIPEDFLISGGASNSNKVTIQVPTNATHLFVVAPDSYYGDNIDPDKDYAVQISTSVPEPSSVLSVLALVQFGGNN